VSAGPFAGLAEICEQIKAKHAAAAAARLAAMPAPVPPRRPTREELLAQLAQARSGFDPSYPYSDNYTEFCLHDRKAQAIARITRELEEA
jgi:hypothetical protein